MIATSAPIAGFNGSLGGVRGAHYLRTTLRALSLPANRQGGRGRRLTIFRKLRFFIRVSKQRGPARAIWAAARRTILADAARFGGMMGRGN
jgi:hypothetical protein